MWVRALERSKGRIGGTPKSLNLDGALRGYYSSKTAQNYGFPVVGPLGAFPPWGDFWLNSAD